MTPKTEVQIMVETLLATKGDAALTVARRRFYASRRRRDEKACAIWLRVADAIRLAAPRADAEAPAPSDVAAAVDRRSPTSRRRRSRPSARA